MFTRYLLPLASAAAVGFAAVQIGKAQHRPPPAAPPVMPATSPFAGAVAAAGLVEPATENIAVGAHLAGVVDEVFVKVGDAVAPGDKLFRLDDRHLKADLAVRQADVANALASLAKLTAAPRPEELPPAAAQVAEAEANLKDQLQLANRSRRLARSNAMAEEEIATREMAVLVAEAKVRKAKADYALLGAGAWLPDKGIAAAAVTRAEAQLAQARTELERLTVTAPRLAAAHAVEGRPAFRVLQVNVRPGEFVGNSPGQGLVVLGHVGRLHVRADIDEADIPRFRPGAGGVAKLRGDPAAEFGLTFVRVEPYVIPKKSLTGGNTERVDTRVLQVIYALADTDRPVYVGQQVDVFVGGDR